MDSQTPDNPAEPHVLDYAPVKPKPFFVPIALGNAFSAWPVYATWLLWVLMIAFVLYVIARSVLEIGFGKPLPRTIDGTSFMTALVISLGIMWYLVPLYRSTPIMRLVIRDQQGDRKLGKVYLVMNRHVEWTNQVISVCFAACEEAKVSAPALFTRRHRLGRLQPFDAKDHAHAQLIVRMPDGPRLQLTIPPREKEGKDPAVTPT